MLWLSGDRDGAQAAARQALALARETGDLSMQSWTIQALATIDLTMPQATKYCSSTGRSCHSTSGRDIPPRGP